MRFGILIILLIASSQTGEYFKLPVAPAQVQILFFLSMIIGFIQDIGEIKKKFWSRR